MKAVCIIQARMGSSRLPGKTLAAISGKTMLEHVVERTMRTPSLNEVVVTTTHESLDNPIEELCKSRGWRVFRGHKRDVLNAYYRAALITKTDFVVRVTGDCPLIDPEVIDNTGKLMVNGVDYANNCIVRHFPRGIDCEWMTFAALEKAWIEDNTDLRVHVTPYIYQHPELFKVAGLINTEDYSHYRWTVDEQKDLDFIRAVFAHFEGNSFSWMQVIHLLEEHPELTLINESVRQKELKEG